MAVKYRVTDVAKDFVLSNNQVIDILAKYSDEARKSQSTLTEEELDFAFDVITKQNSVKDFNEYFAMGENARKEAAAAKAAEKDRKLAEQAAILEQFKAAAAAQKAAEEAAKASKPEVKKEAPAKAEPKKETPKKAEPKKEAPKKEEPKKEEPKKEPKVSVPIAPRKKDKPAGEAPNRGPAEIRKVDTKAFEVNMDKYNEKYENIAPADSMRDNMQRKQKIKQKSQEYRKPKSGKK